MGQRGKLGAGVYPTARANAGDGGGAAEFTPIAGTTNWLKANVSHALTAMTAVKGGTGQCPIGIKGDSTTAGQGSNNVSGSRTNMKAACAPTQLAALLNAASIPALKDNFFGDSGTASFAELLAADTHMSTGGTGTGFNVGSFQTVGGGTIGNSVDTTETFIYTFSETVDTAVIAMMQYSGAGTLKYSIDGAAEVTNSLVNAARGVKLITVSLGANAANHTIAIRNSAGSVFGIAMWAYSSVTKSLLILNQGKCSAKTDDIVITAQGESWGNNLNVAGAKLAFVNCVLNDQASRPSPTTSMSNLQTIITGLRATGCDPILVMPHSRANDTTIQNAYLSAMQTLANSNNCPCLDLASVYTNVTLWQAAGFDSGDSLHPNGAGYGYIAGRYRELISAMWAAA